MRVGAASASEQALAHLVGGVGAAFAFRPRDRRTGRRDAHQPGNPEEFPDVHAPRLTIRAGRLLALDDAADLTRTGDIWLFRGENFADRAIRAATNAPVNHVGMAVVLDDLPPLLWHAELGRSLPDVGGQTPSRRAAARAARRGDDVASEVQAARLPPSAPRDSDETDGGRAPPGNRPAGRHTIPEHGRPQPPLDFRAAAYGASLETLYCAELVASTYQAMGLLPANRPVNWFDPGRFWSGDELALLGGATLGEEIEISAPTRAASIGT